MDCFYNPVHSPLGYMPGSIKVASPKLAIVKMVNNPWYIGIAMVYLNNKYGHLKI